MAENESEIIEWLYGSKQIENVQKIKNRSILTVDNRTALELNEVVSSTEIRSWKKLKLRFSGN